MGRQIEVTQFSAVEFNAWLTASPRPEMKPLRKKAFEEFEKQKLFNDQVVRVRVLRDSEDVELKTLTFNIEKKFAEKSKWSETRAEPPPMKKFSPKVTRPQSLLIPNIRDRVLSELDKAAGFLTLAKEEDLARKTKAIHLLASESDLTDLYSASVIREMLMAMLFLIKWEPRTEKDEATAAKIMAWSAFDLVNGLITVSSRLETLMDRDELKMLYNRLYKPPNPRAPQSHPRNLPPMKSLAPNQT